MIPVIIQVHFELEDSILQTNKWIRTIKNAETASIERSFLNTEQQFTVKLQNHEGILDQVSCAHVCAIITYNP